MRSKSWLLLVALLLVASVLVAGSSGELGGGSRGIAGATVQLFAAPPAFDDPTGYLRDEKDLDGEHGTDVELLWRRR